MAVMGESGEIVVAGHICLDLIPAITSRRATIAELMKPGTLVNVGPAVISTGGCVANTGLALHRLGDRVRLVGKVGDDAFARVVLDVLRSHGGHLAEGMVVDSQCATSYTAVISPPGIDRVFLHHPGANDTFDAGDVTDEHLRGAKVFHFGYPPIMRRMFDNGGTELASLMRRAKQAGLVTSLDLSMPDPESDSGKADWPALFSRVLPHVDIIMPSLDEIAFMLKHPAKIDADNLRHLAEWLIGHGAKIVVLKLGDKGLYLKTGNVDLPIGNNSEWSNRELVTPCYEANLAGTTGSGDCTVAGFLSEFAFGSSPEDTLSFATAVGAFSVEQPDATSGVKHRSEVTKRMHAGWRKHPLMPELQGIKQVQTAKEIAG